jgi:hypothetical protein
MGRERASKVIEGGEWKGKGKTRRDVKGKREGKRRSSSAWGRREGVYRL